MPQSAPLSDAIVVAVAGLVADSQESGFRAPSHSDLTFYIDKVGLSEADPRTMGLTVGKRKRLLQVLNSALEGKPTAGEQLIAYVISAIQGDGGFRLGTSNYVGDEAIANAVEAFRREGFSLEPDGSFTPLVLENLQGTELTEALNAYVRRAQRGVLDAALVTGTGKDLLEAVAKHVLVQKWGSFPETNFPGLLGQAFVALDLATPQDPKRQNEPAHKDMERALFQLGCTINKLRNKEGTGHGRPFLSSVSDSQAGTAVESMGILAGYLLAHL